MNPFTTTCTKYPKKNPRNLPSKTEGAILKGFQGRQRVIACALTDGRRLTLSGCFLVTGDARSAGAVCGALGPGAVDVGHIAVLRRFYQAVSTVRLQQGRGVPLPSGEGPVLYGDF